MFLKQVAGSSYGMNTMPLSLGNIILLKEERGMRVTGRKTRGLQMEEIGCKCQIFFLISPLSGRRKQTLYGNVFLKLY